MLRRGEDLELRTIHNGRSRAWFIRAVSRVAFILAIICRCRAQSAFSPLQATSGNTGNAVTVISDITGVVVDARNHSPIPRALVHLGNRAVLTGHDGGFTFPQVTASTASLFANKPGFYATPDGDGVQPRSYRLPLASPVEILLYPEAVLSGSVVSQAGEGLSGLSVTALRSAFDESGHRWVPAGQSQTSSNGEYRLAVPSGRYMLRVNQRGRPDGGAEVVLPIQVPAVSSSGTGTINVLPGEESRLELRADVRRAYTVSLHLEGETRGFPTLTAKTANGSLIPLGALPTRDQGDLRVSLPAGTYTILASMQNQDGIAEGQVQVTVTDHDVSGVVLRFSHAATLPVVVEADSSAKLDSNTKLPDANQLGLTLRSRSDGQDGGAMDLRVTSRKNSATSFAVADGVYRLHGQPGGQWYVSAATCGGVD